MTTLSLTAKVAINRIGWLLAVAVALPLCLGVFLGLNQGKSDFFARLSSLRYPLF